MIQGSSQAQADMQFELATTDGWPYYHFPDATDAGIIHGFMTKSSDAAITHDEERRRFVEAFRASRAVILNQEHGDTVHVVRSGERPRAGDGLVLMEKGVLGVIKTADCLPVVLYDIAYPLAAIVHAGWRGTVSRIAAKAVRTMIGLGAGRGNISALIGPGIGPCCYHVGDDVAGRFRRAGFGEHIFKPKNDTIYLDLRQANRDVLEEAGIENIAALELCTSCNPHLFFSARRDKGEGRQINFVLL